MSSLSHTQISDRIAALERRLENRRVRLKEDSREAADAASYTAARILPVAAAVGAGLLAWWMTRRRRQVFVPRGTEEARRGLRWASIAGIVGSAIRIGTSPQARILWRAFNNRR